MSVVLSCFTSQHFGVFLLACLHIEFSRFPSVKHLLTLQHQNHLDWNIFIHDGNYLLKDMHASELNTVYHFPGLGCPEEQLFPS